MHKYPIFWSFFNILKFANTKHVGKPPHPPTHPTLTEAWCKERVRIWKEGALMGILNQTVSDWRYYLLCDVRTREWLEDELSVDPRVIPLWITYASGEAPWDPQASAQILASDLPKADRYYLFRSDSDDLWHPKVAEETLAIDTEYPFIVFRKGYIYDRRNNRLKNYYSPSGPMHVHLYNNWPGPRWSEGAHNHVTQWKFVEGPPDRYMVTVHDANTTTHFETKQCQDLVRLQAEKDRILREFGLLKVLPT